jgi:hypothetical protein
MWTCPGCREEIEAGFDACWNCGTTRDGRPDPGFRRADEPDPPRPPSAGVSVVCPKCGGAEFQPTRPDGWLAYAQDRICTGCGTRYTPPTPRWAAFTFVGLGTVMATGGVMGLLARVALGSEFGLAGVVGEGLIGVLGFAALRHGLRALRHPGTV